MPEGHTVHRMAQDHKTRFAVQRLSVTSPQVRFEDEAILLNGNAQKVADTYFTARYLFNELA